ncbi:hypothetical protein EDD16DRAFT_1732893 [Pisolithus croceorrhizus]|nr:hypothetical protein EDD16DRAFT_1732893 [Pisolithus croceorrhizus]
MTEYHRRQRLLSSRLAGWWAGLGWAHPSNFPVNASITGSHGGSRGNQGCAAYLSTSTIAGCRDRKSEREARGCAACLNKSTNAGHRDHESGREVDRESPIIWLPTSSNGSQPELEGGIRMFLDRFPRSQQSRQSLRSLHESQFTRIWPFWPQKKQNEYAQRGERLAGSLRSSSEGCRGKFEALERPQPGELGLCMLSRGNSIEG